jgi:hypothetical protein
MMGEAKAKAEELARQLEGGEACGTCRFVRTDGCPPGQGRCQRHPPTMLVANTQPVQDQKTRTVQSVTTGVIGHFPVMELLQGWCGEWEPKRSMMQ